MLARVQIQKQIDQGPFQARPGTLVQNESAAGNFRRAGEVEHSKRLANLPMGFGLKRIFRLRSPPANLWIVCRLFPNCHRGLRQIRNHQQHTLQLRLDSRNLLVERGDLVADLFHRRHRGAGILPLRFGNPDLFAHLIALGLEPIALGCQFAALLVQHGNLRNPRLITPAARGEALLHQFWVFTN